MFCVLIYMLFGWHGHRIFETVARSRLNREAAKIGLEVNRWLKKVGNSNADSILKLAHPNINRFSLIVKRFPLVAAILIYILQIRQIFYFLGVSEASVRFPGVFQRPFERTFRYVSSWSILIYFFWKFQENSKKISVEFKISWNAPAILWDSSNIPWTPQKSP